MHCRPLTSTLFPYTTLFRSVHLVDGDDDVLDAQERDYEAVPASLRQHPLAGVDQHDGQVDGRGTGGHIRSEEHTSELQSRRDLVCRLLLEKKKKQTQNIQQP